MSSRSKSTLGLLLAVGTLAAFASVALGQDREPRRRVVFTLGYQAWTSDPQWSKSMLRQALAAGYDDQPCRTPVRGVWCYSSTTPTRRPQKYGLALAAVVPVSRDVDIRATMTNTHFGSVWAYSSSAGRLSAHASATTFATMVGSDGSRHFWIAAGPALTSSHFSTRVDEFTRESHTTLGLATAAGTQLHVGMFAFDASLRHDWTPTVQTARFNPTPGATYASGSIAPVAVILSHLSYTVGVGLRM